MSNERPLVTRRQCLAGSVVSFGGVAGCLGLLDADDESESPVDDEADDATTPDESSDSGPLQVNGIEHVAGERTVEVTLTVENTGEEARQADLVVALSHTEAEGLIGRDRPILLAGGFEREIVLVFRPQFLGGDGVDSPEEGEFRFEAHFENVEISEDYPGLVTPSDRSAIDGGNAWPGVAYDSGASAFNPGTKAPRAAPTSAWTASDVEYAHRASGPVVADGTVVTGRDVRALSVADGGEQWVHDGPVRTSTLAAGEDIVAFGTPEDFRALEADTGEVRWTVPSGGDIWDGSPTIADSRVYTSNGQLHAIDVASGEVVWTADTGGSLTGPPPVADGVVVSGGDPLRAIDAEEGTVRWAVSGAEPITAAAVAFDTVFALTDSQLVALDLAEGRTRWFAPGPFQAGRICVANGSVYAQRSGDYRMVSIDATNGDVEWESGGTDGVLGPPSASDGVLVVVSEMGTLYGFDTETGEELWSTNVPSGVPGSLAVADGVAYFNEPNGPLRALTADE
ncbi:PQQ-binding-like beta-propeller repeat protein [Natronoglomus mannanivorans]|uniref:PQQ-binding-like beta-propeller repeat protein n=1 Tax=Natronoglomus mannanivorans TaxID=2979990 RepID=A0AAP2YYF9_9EURY|nr:PQQ-binding-like beta-propeller repeat protein [Halobacteria archaeon AArc-xg1-1]